MTTIENYLIASMILNILLVICFFSPSIIYQIHKVHFVWRENLTDLFKAVQKIDEKKYGSAKNLISRYINEGKYL